MDEIGLLKKDLFGEIRQITAPAGSCIERDVRSASPWVRWLARRLLQREARALAALEGLDGIPDLVSVGRDTLMRMYLPGIAMQHAQPRDPAWFRKAFRLLRRMHRCGVVHNDLAKEPNLLVQDDGEPAFLDFQLAWFAPGRGRFYRTLAYEDLRHLLKHKRTYCPHHLTLREKAILANPSPVSRLWMGTVKPVYLFVTRRLIGWADREGASDRGAQR